MVHLRTLGGVEISGEDGSSVTLRSKKHVSLLVLLACNPRRVYPRSRLCEFFWTSSDERARHSLSQAIYDIGQRLGPVIRRGPGEDLAINPQAVVCDVGEFEAAVRSGELGTAVRIYGGPFADNLVGIGTAEFERWLEAERTRLARLGEITLRRYVDECERIGQWGEMCLAGLKLAALAPLDQEVHRGFMRALWLHGEGASALRHYDSVVTALESELPDGVSTQTKELVDRIRKRPTQQVEVSQSTDREPPFVGRESEFRILTQTVAHIGRGATTAIVVSGEAGIGKSRLLKEFAHSLQLQPVRLLTSRCYQAEEDLPYSPFVDAIMPLAQDMMATDATVGDRFRRLAYLLPDFGSREGQEDDRDSVDPAAWRRQLFDQAASFLATAARAEPIVWLVDDAHWIDRASGGLIHYLSRRLSSLPFLLVLTVRSNGESEDATTTPAVGPLQMEGSATLRIPLKPLSEKQIRNIVGHASVSAPEHPATELAVRLSGGNPFYALEVLEAATESREWAQSATAWDPLNHDRLRKVLDVRVNGISRKSVRILEAIAVLERHARPRHVADVAGCSLTEAAQFGEVLYKRSLVVDDAERIAFSNDVMREFVYSRMTSMQRAALHLRAGKALEAEMDSTPGVLATHFLFGDDWPRSFGYAIEAARSAQSSAGHNEAAHFAGIAVKVAPGFEERRVALSTRAESLSAAGELSEAATCYREILRSNSLDVSDASDTYLRLAATEIERCNWRAAGSALDGCQRTIHRVQSADARLFLIAEHATLQLKLATRTDDTSLAYAAASAIDEAVNGVGELKVASNQTKLAILTAKAVLVGLNGPIAEALVYLNRAANFIQDAQMRQVSRYFTYRGIVKAWAADWDAAEADFEHSRSLAERFADRVGIMTQWNNLACVALERGDWSAAQDRLGKAAQLQSGLELSNDTSLPIILNEGNLFFYQGLLASAAETYDSAARMCSEQASSDKTAEVIACQGLVSIQRREKLRAKSYWEALRNTRQPGLGARERFKVAWFTAAMNPDLLRSAYLLEIAEDEKQRDVSSHLKLLWLNAILSNGESDAQPRALHSLKNHGLGWFSFFAKRWARAAGFAV